MNHKIAVFEARQSRAKQSLNYIRGYTEEPEDGLRRSFRRFLEKRQLVNRRMLLSDVWPVAAKIHEPFKGMENPDHLFYYGRPDNFARWKEFSTSDERISGVACYDETNDIVWYSAPPARHGNLLSMMHEYGYGDWRHAHIAQGFLTSRGRFLNREQALLMAAQQNQLIRKTDPKDRLFSEDLFTGCI